MGRADGGNYAEPTILRNRSSSFASNDGSQPPTNGMARRQNDEAPAVSRQRFVVVTIEVE